MVNKISWKTTNDGELGKSRLNLILTATIWLLVSFTFSSQAQAESICGPEIRDEVARALNAVADMPDKDRAALEASIYEKYAYCADDVTAEPLPNTATTQDSMAITIQAVAPISFLTAARVCGATVPYVGSLYYEHMSCCGYDPQARLFGCPVTIKQPFGFGSGSREYVLHCVADNAGVFVPVGVDSVHLANAVPGSGPPPWQFAVIARANQNLQTVYPLNGQMRRARSILSWGFQPTSCSFKPSWGDVLEYQIRLDP